MKHRIWNHRFYPGILCGLFLLCAADCGGSSGARQTRTHASEKRADLKINPAKIESSTLPCDAISNGRFQSYRQKTLAPGTLREFTGYFYLSFEKNSRFRVVQGQSGGRGAYSCSNLSQDTARLILSGNGIQSGRASVIFESYSGFLRLDNVLYVYIGKINH